MSAAEHLDANPLLTAALAYAARGWRVFPCWGLRPDRHCACGVAECQKNAGKHPLGLATPRGCVDATTDPDTIQQWWARWPDANVAIATGRESNLIVLDCDPRHDGDESLIELEANFGRLPESPASLTGGGGTHSLFAHPGGRVKSRNGLPGYPGLDLKADGGYIIAPPSLHASGREYAWNVALHPDDVPLVPAPAWLLALVATPADASGGARDAGGDAIEAGVRNSTLASLAGTMRRRGMAPEEIAAALREVNRRRCNPPLPDEEVLAIARSVGRYQPQGEAQEREQHDEQTRGMADADDESSASPCEDKANALRIARHFGADLRWCAPLGWITWTGQRWEPSETRPLLIASRLGRVIHREAAELSEAAAKSESESERARLGAMNEAFTRWAKASEAAKRIKAALDLARVYLEIPLDALDANPCQLNCANGTVDLRTGELRPHRRDDYLTKTTGIAYDADARSELWDRVLERAIPESPVRAFLQRCAGYTALGRKGEDVLLVIYGPTRTAKGTIQGAIAAALGEYGDTAGLEALAERDRKDGARARPELVRLRGARMVNIYETGRALRLDDALVKTLAGSDEIVARALYQPEVRFRPSFALWIATNHRPRIRDDDDALWQRIREVPFDVQIPEDERDPSVRARLADPADAGPAVLAWIAAGALAYQRDGLAPPDRVRDATAEYRDAMDPLLDFLAECCSLGADRWALSADLRRAYEAFTRERGGKPIDSKEWAASLRRHDCEPTRREAGRGWQGIGLLGPETMTP